jgi:hypothetical protein
VRKISAKIKTELKIPLLKYFIKRVAHLKAAHIIQLEVPPTPNIQTLLASV